MTTESAEAFKQELLPITINKLLFQPYGLLVISFELDHLSCVQFFDEVHQLCERHLTALAFQHQNCINSQPKYSVEYLEHYKEAIFIAKLAFLEISRNDRSFDLQFLPYYEQTFIYFKLITRAIENYLRERYNLDPDLLSTNSLYSSTRNIIIDSDINVAVALV